MSALTDSMRDEVVQQQQNAPETLSVGELVQLCALDGLLFSRIFFPKTARMGSPTFHREMWEMYDDPSARYINQQIFRGGAKTSIARIFSAKRIAYALSHTMLYIGKSEDHALRSVSWIRKAVEFNSFYATTFGLTKGTKWQSDQAEIRHETLDQPIWLQGLGITGSIRGVNFDDYRPDFILVDDVVDDANASTPDQRDKISRLLLGAVKESLAPATEAPMAKMAIIQTPIDKEDPSCRALKDPEFHSLVRGCWTPETAELPVDKRRSSWEERYPTETLQKERAAAIKRNMLSVFSKEKECKAVAAETCAFLPEWIRFYEQLPSRADMVVTAAIDPVPPPTEIAIAKGMHKRDYECLAVVGRLKGGSKTFLLEYVANRGHEPDWTINEFFRLQQKWRPRFWRVESTAYQKTLHWILQTAMRKLRIFALIKETTDRRSKYDRIVDAMSGLCSVGDFYCSPEHQDFISQFTDYPNVPHDDVLETVAVAVSDLGLEGDMDVLEVEQMQNEIPPLDLSDFNGAP